MKQLILIIALSSILFSIDLDKFINPFGDDHQNPNGKPFSLTLSTQLNVTDGFGWDAGFSLPITSWMTVKGVYYWDYYESNDVFHTNPSDGTHGDVGHNTYRSEYKIFDFGAEFHIPLYKLWEK